jgi:hypothetical protein
MKPKALALLAGVGKKKLKKAVRALGQLTRPFVARDAINHYFM